MATSNKSQLAVLFCIAFLVVGSFQAGVVHVDRIYSSADSKITVQNLSGATALVNTTTTQNVEFIRSSGLSIEAPLLNIGGNFVKVSTNNSVDLNSKNDTVTLSAGASIDINALSLSFSGNGTNATATGGINFLSREAFDAAADTISLNANQGGIAFGSLSGPVEFYSANALTLRSNQDLVFKADEDIALDTEQSLIGAFDTLLVFADKSVAIDSTTSVSLASAGNVVLKSDSLTTTSKTLSASGFSATVSSLGDQLSVYAFRDLALQSGRDVQVTGRSDGIRAVADSDVNFVSVSGSVSFSTTASSDLTGIYVQSDLARIQTADDFTVDALLSVELVADYIQAFNNSNTFDYRVNRDSYVYSASELALNGQTVSVTANVLTLQTTDSTTANNYQGAIDLASLLASYTARDEFTIRTDAFSLASNVSDVSIRARNQFKFNSDYPNSYAQSTLVNIGGAYSARGGDLTINGGEIRLSSAASASLTASELNLLANVNTLASLNFTTGGNSNWNVQNSLVNTHVLTFNTGSFSVNTGNINLAATKDFAWTADALSIVADNDVSITAATDLRQNYLNAITVNALEQLELSGVEFYSTSRYFQLDNFDVGRITASRDIILTTDRNELTNDFISLQYNTTTINAPEVFFQGPNIVFVGKGQVFTGNDINVNTNALIFNIGDSFNVLTNSALNVEGNSINFISDINSVSVNAGNAIDINAASRGINVKSGGDLVLNADQSLIIATVDELILAANDTFTFDQGLVLDVATEQETFIHSLNGTVSYSTAGPFTWEVSNNSTFSTGDDLGDGIAFIANGALSFNPAVTDFASFTVDVNAGPIEVNSVGTIDINVGNYFFNVSGTTNVTASTSFNVNSDENTLMGGDIVVKSSGTISATAGSIIISNNQTSLAGEEYYDINDAIRFRSGDDILITSTGATGAVNVQAGGAITIQTSTPVAGDINFTGEDIMFSSNLENNDISFKSGGVLSWTLLNDLTVTSDGDYRLTADQAIAFTQNRFSAVIYDNFNITAQAGFISIDNTGSEISINTNAIKGIDRPRDNIVEFTADGQAEYFAASMSFTATGSNNARRNVDGLSNAESQIDQLVGFSARTYDPNGNLVFQARDNVITYNAYETIAFQSDDRITIDTTFEQTYTTDDIFTMVAEDGEIEWYGATGVLLSATNSLAIFAHRYAVLNSNRDTSYTAADDFDITSYHGDIYFENFNNQPVTIASVTDSTFTAGNSFAMQILGDIQLTAGGRLEVTGDRGFYASFSGEEVTLTATDLGSSIFATETLNAFAGGDLVLTNDPEVTEDMEFTGDGVRFTTTGDDITSTALNNVFNSKRALISATGTTSTGRDLVSFISGVTGTQVAAENGDITIDSGNLISLGTNAQPPIVTISGQGSIDEPGVIITSDGNIEFSSDDFSITSSESFQGYSLASTAFTSGGELNIATGGDLNFNAFNGAITIIATTDMTQNAFTDLVITSEGFTSYSTGEVVVTTGTFINLSGFQALTTVGGDLTAFSEEGTATITTARYDDAATGTTFPSTGSILSIDVGTEITLTSADDIAFSSDNLLNIQTAALTWTTDASTTVEFEADNGNFVWRAIGSTDSQFTLNADNTDISASNVTLQTSNKDGAVLAPGVGDITLNSATVYTLTVGTNSYFNVGNDYTLDVPAGDHILTLAEEYVVYVNDGITLDFDTTFETTQDQLDINTELLDINFTGLEISATTDGPISFLANGTLFWNSGDTLVFTAADNFTVITDNQDAKITYSVSSATFTGKAGGGFTAAAGDRASQGTVTLDTAGPITWNAQTFTLNGIPTETSPSSAVIINAASSTYTTPIFTAQALTDETPEEDQGAIFIEYSSATFTVTNDATISANNASITMNTLKDSTFTGTTLINVLSSGVDAGVTFEGSTILPITPATFLVNAGTNADFDVGSQLGVTVSGAYNIVSNGAPSDSAAGIQFRTHEDDGAISLTTPVAFTASADGNINFIGTDTILKTATATTGNILYTAPYFNVQTDASYTAGTLPPAGIVVNSVTTTFNIEDDINISAGSTFTTTATTNLFSAPDDEGDVNIFAHGSVNIDGTTASPLTASNNVRFVAHQEGITVDRSALGLFAYNGGDLSSLVGTVTDGAKNQFRASVGVTFNAADNINIQSSANQYIQAQRTMNLGGGNNVNILATKGDILFRSITPLNPNPPGPYTTTISADDTISMTAFYRIEHPQHFFLGFFTPQTQNGRSANTPYAPQQSTNVFQAFDEASACGCLSGFCGNVDCPEAANTILQIQRALVQYGLLAIA